MNRLARTLLLIPVLALAIPAGDAAAQYSQDVPEEAQGIGVEQKIGATLPLNAEFTDDRGRKLVLGELFDGRLPVVLSFNYTDCPKQCIYQLNNLASALQTISLVPGRDFRIVSISIDPHEQIAKLASAKRNYVVGYGDLDTASGWHFLKGSPDSIRQATGAAGITYKYIPAQRLYWHPTAFIFCTPQGVIARYLDGMSGELDKSLKLAIVEAGEGRIGSVIDRVLYFSSCFEFNPHTGRYSASAMAVMRIGAIATAVVLFAGLVPYWLGARHSAAESEDGKADGEPVSQDPNH